MQREKSASASAMRTSDVVFGFIWQAFFTSDDVQLLSVLGAGMVMAGVCIIVIFKSQSVPREDNHLSNNISKDNHINNSNSLVSSKGDVDVEMSEIFHLSNAPNSEESIGSAIHLGEFIKSSLSFKDPSKPSYMPLEVEERELDRSLSKSSNN